MPGGASSPASASRLVNLGWAQARLLDSQFRTHVGGRQDGRRSTGPRPGPEAPGQGSPLASLGDSRWQRRGWRTWGGKGDRLAGALPPVRPRGAGSVQKRDADCENRREGGSWVISFANHRLRLLLPPPSRCPRSRPHSNTCPCQSLTHFEPVAALYGKNIRTHHSAIYLQRRCRARGRHVDN